MTTQPIAPADKTDTAVLPAQCEDVPYRYWAFISYSHRDIEWVSRFHARLETWPVPRKLIGRQTPLGAVPRRLFPIFRDRDELSGGASLDEVIQAALRQSRYLIVICSPRSAASKYVNEEIRFFKASGRDARVIYVIIGGDPAAGDCFPPISFRKAAPDGTCLEGRVEPMAADARPGRDGPRDAMLKVLALLLNVSFDEIKRRDLRRRRRARRFRGAAGTALTLLLAAAYVGVSDAGLRVPGGEFIRARLDRHEASVFRSVPGDAQIRRCAAAVSDELRAVLLSKQQPDGWFNDSPVGEQPGVSIMSHAQAATALLARSDPGPSQSAAATSALGNLFRTDVFIQRDGVKWGWWSDLTQQQIEAFMPLWTATALCESLRHSDATSAGRPRLLQQLADTQDVLRLYHSDADPGGWNAFPFQADPARHSVYASTLALLALNEARRANVAWDGSTDRRDVLARQTAHWLISQYRSSGPRHGWLNDPLEEHASDVFDGMSAQTYAALLDAEQTVSGIELPEAMHDDIRVYLGGCAQRGMDYPVDVGEFRLAYRHLDGTVRVDRDAVRYLWWPWVIRTADLWLRYAARRGLPHEQTVQVRRALAHLVIDLGPQQVSQAAKDYTYVLSEGIYGLHDLDRK